MDVCPDGCSFSITQLITNQWSRITMISAITHTTRYVTAVGMLFAVLWLFPQAESAAQPIPSGNTLTVTTLVDELDTTAAPGLGAGTSLREAVAYSDTGDVIDFDGSLTGTIFLSIGQIEILHDLFISGPGLDIIEVNGNDLHRIFVVDTGSSVAISGLTLASGRAVDGAAIQSFGWLSVSSSALRWSTAIQRGGAIYQEGDTLRLTSTRIEHCEAYIHGGGIASMGAVVLIDQSSMSENTAGGNGGVLYLNGGAAVVNATTMENNYASGNGGAVSSSAGTGLVVSESTFNDNRASSGGAIDNAGALTLTSSTLSGNTADNNGGGLRSTGSASSDFSTIAFNHSAQGGGAHISGSFIPRRTIFAENTATTGPDVRGTVSSGGTNLVKIRNGSSGWNGSDLTGTTSDPLNAALDELRLNGGTTRTHALLVCSRAIDAGSTAAPIPATDQRGATRVINGDHDANARPDIGAYEAQMPLDNDPPIINGHPAFTVYLDASGSATITKDTLLLSAYDNCEILSTSASKLNYSCADTGSVNVTLTATDRSYNVTTQVITVQVVDDLPPDLTVPADVTINASTANCGLTLTSGQLGTATATDGCGTPSITNDAPSFFPVGSTLVIWKATDASGNESVGTQNVTVIDNSNPVVTAPANVNVNTLPNQCAVPNSQVSLGTPTVTDNCSFTISNDAPPSFPLGATTVTWTAVDASGNSASAQQTVTVVDAVAPILFAPADLTLVADTGSCSRSGASVSLGIPTYSDNCSAVTVSNDKPATFPIGQTSVTWTAIDGTGNISTAVQTVTIFDGNPPTVIAPPNLEVGVDPGTCAWTVVPSVLGTATTYDNCSAPNVTNSAGSSLAAGTHRVIWTAVDANGNRSTDVQIVTVVGDPPTIACPSNITMNTDPGMPGAVVTFVPPTASSGCSEYEIIRTSDLGSGDFFPVGTTAVSYMAIDASNQIAMCGFDVTIIDNEPPQISVNLAPVYLWPANNQINDIKATVEVWDNVPGATVVLTSVTSDQPANGDILGVTTNILDTEYQLRAKNVGGPRVYTALYTAQDVAGNFTTASATVTVPTHKPKDFESEELPVPVSVTLEQNYPNPFNPSTMINFGSPVEQHIELRVFNAMGMLVRTLVDEVVPAGTYTVEWDGRNDGGQQLSSGVYLYMIRAGSSHMERKMVLTR
ncbi:MAG: hypothetical protein C0600_04810 [Ignavibacteria bacterium]|nr:MAG: hypothetical protein C0600_04810 [Ignavibacteria bacterium]